MTGDSATALDRLHDALTRYVILPTPEAVDAVALWIAATHAQPAWAHAPRLVIRAPEKRCGKSRLLDVVEATCHNPLITVNASTAAVYRSIDEDPPTLLVDEADTIFGTARSGDAKEDLRGLLNAGHQRNRPAIRWDHTTRTREVLPTFAMAALAGIGAMPDTVEDRAVIIRMRRRAAGETVAPYRHRRDRPALRTLAEDLSAWLRPALPELEQAEPDMPVDDRAADTWEPLIAVADHAGEAWPDRARQALAVLLAETAAADEDPSITVRLLSDTRTAFGTDTAITTTRLLTLLNADVEAPWADMGPGGLTARRLAALLREYGIHSRNIRPDNGEQAKGYERAAFTDAWRRYCPPPTDPPDGPDDRPAWRWDGSIRPTVPPAPPPTSTDDVGTDGTAPTHQHAAA
ncbi:Protein of unknown function (DUF3631) [Parafrankia irregularis]|uniref:DUF3631 domain-containing protein n=1 Tax=Parafrankia irregularis TaxID=795642 RepID=A0A0S4QQD7_9ACTN|nr:MULTISPECIES: DUF3631 domain-containing protein [Parafrankia]MBE3202640.1 DUF3631 domain-containing protein [Parafrankia sp. CH37]CUU57824.1 Protein of unknown function (DUF3631) [Parafrankia irregularis]